MRKISIHASRPLIRIAVLPVRALRMLAQTADTVAVTGDRSAVPDPLFFSHCEAPRQERRGALPDCCGRRSRYWQYLKGWQSHAKERRLRPRANRSIPSYACCRGTTRLRTKSISEGD
jgi:hypothetical protein